MLPNPKATLEALQELERQLTRLTATAHGRRVFLASIPLLLSACATPARHRNREGDNSGQQTALTPADEARMTQEVLPQMRKEYPAISDPYLQNYITGLGGRIVAANGLGGRPYNYNFTVVGVPYVNAFALPAGTVFVTAPLIAMADTEAELAGVVGHEIGHIKARHTAERMEVAKREQGKSWLYGAGGGFLGAAAGFGLGKLLCKPQDKACLVKATGAGAAAGVAGGLLVQKFAFMANSREDEMEADRVGFRTSVAANYRKENVGEFYSKLLAMEQTHKKSNTPVLSSIADAMSTHPPSQERVEQMKQMVASTPQNTSAARSSSKEFDRAKTLCVEWMKRNPPKQA